MPTAGDLDSNETYTAVGAMASIWETIEFDLCRIFSAFCNERDGEAMRLYGSKRAFPGRLDEFSRMADAHFVKHPDQAHESELHHLLVEIKGFVDRRNEVIHGIVLQLNNLAFFRQYLADKSEKPLQFAVIPPYHMIRSHGADGFPLYAYNSSMITQLVKLMWSLHQRLEAFRKALPS